MERRIVDPLAREVQREYLQWKSRLPVQPDGEWAFPAVDADEGSPAGWRFTASALKPGSGEGAGHPWVHLYEHPRGGWVVVCDAGHGIRTVWKSAPSLFALYRLFVDGLDLVSFAEKAAEFEAVIEFLEPMVAALYSDSVEGRAEVTLAVLRGERFTVAPQGDVSQTG